MQALSSFEGKLLLFIQEHIRCAALDGPMTFVTHLGDSGLFWIALTLALLLFRRTRRVGLFCAAAMVLNLLVTNVALKNIIQRIRPYDVMDSLKILVAPEHDFSFPSGHTACSFAAAWTIFRTAPRRYGTAALVLAALIALSRLYVGVHYPTDVLGGLIVGVAAAELAVRALTRFAPKTAA